MQEHRPEAPPEEITNFYAHAGECRFCGGTVKMLRDPKTLKLLPDKCWCLQCGQRYYVNVADIEAWEIEQWKQKARVEAER